VESIDDEEFDIIMASTFIDRTEDAISEMARCRNCPANDTCKNSKDKRD
jgi:hypothetical protein